MAGSTGAFITSVRDYVALWTRRAFFGAGLRLVGSVLMKIHDEWQAGRRYFGLDSMHKLKEPEKLEMALPTPLRLAPIH